MATLTTHQVGLINAGQSAKPGVVITSQDLQRMSDEKLREIIPTLRVIARALPTDKSRFVRVAQSLSKVVA